MKKVSQKIPAVVGLSEIFKFVRSTIEKKFPFNSKEKFVVDYIHMRECRKVSIPMICSKYHRIKLPTASLIVESVVCTPRRLSLQSVSIQIQQKVSIDFSSLYPLSCAAPVSDKIEFQYHHRLSFTLERVGSSHKSETSSAGVESHFRRIECDEMRK